MSQASTPKQNVMIQYAIYERPSDFPEAYVVREWFVESGLPPRPAPEIYAAATTLEAARMWIPATHEFCITRSPGDDPVIVETWI